MCARASVISSRSAIHGLRVLAGIFLCAAGCAGQDPFTQRRTTVGTLKASISRLEAERNTLEDDLAQLKTNHDRLAEQLVEERTRGDQLATRLDSAKAMLARQGLDVSTASDLPVDRSESIRTIPPSRITPANRPRHKAPFAQIPGGITELPFEAEGGSGSSRGSGSRPGLGTEPRRPAFDEPDIFDSMPSEPTEREFTPLSRATPGNWRPGFDDSFRR
jgi:outer membrane murein-binding lipoprotein Lpp